MWPLTASSLIFVYIGLQHGQISMDGLTGLNNRRRLNQYMETLAEKSPGGWYFALLDVDHFKSINDRYGHLMGDEALKTVAEVMKGYFAHFHAFLARYGGDEFAIVFKQDDEAAVKRELALMQIAVQEAAQKHGRPWALSISAGYARWQPGDLIDDVIARADACMYENKAGKGCAEAENERG